MSEVRVERARWQDPEARAAMTKLRTEIFVDEQGVPPELELDGLDDACEHVLARAEDGRPIGTARMQANGHLGRIAVVPECRKRGIGAKLVAALINRARAAGLSAVDLDSQLSAVGFYDKLGFRARGDVFLEAGIEHQNMFLELEPAAGERPLLRSRLLLLRFPPEFAGGGIQASRLMEQLAGCGVEMVALTAMPAGASAPGDERAFGGRVIRFRVPRSEILRDAALSVCAAYWLCRHPRWDVLHISSFSYFAVLPMLVAKAFGRPVLLKTTLLGEKGGAFSPSGGRVGAWILGIHRHATAFVALSEALERDLLEHAQVHGDVHRIPNGVDPELFRPAAEGERLQARERFGLDAQACVVVTCGMILPRKNVLALVRAAAAASARPMVVAIAGPDGPDPDYLTELQAEIASTPAGVEVRLMGELAPADLAVLLRASDVFALTSRAEGLPNSLLEAMSAGLACVATDIPGSADVLQGGGGKLVPLDDITALASALDALAGDAAERARLGAEALEKIRSNYSFASVANRYRALYDALIRS